MTAAGARVEDGFPHHSRRSTLWCATGVWQHDHIWSLMIHVSMYVKLHHDSPWFIRSSLFEPIVHLQFHLIQFAAPEAVGKFISTNQIKRSFGIFVVNMGKPRNIKALTPHFRNDLSTHLWTSALDVRMTNYTLCHWPSNFWCSHLFSTGLPLQSVPWNDSKLLSWLDLMIFPRRSRNAIPLTPPTNPPFPRCSNFGDESQCEVDNFGSCLLLGVLNFLWPKNCTAWRSSQPSGQKLVCNNRNWCSQAMSSLNL